MESCVIWGTAQVLELARMMFLFIFIVDTISDVPILPSFSIFHPTTALPSLWPSPLCCLCYGSCIYVRWLIPSPSFIRSPHPLLSESCKSVLRIYASISILFVSLLFHQIPHKSEIIWYVSFSDWLISLSIIISRYIHTLSKGKISFFFMATQYSIV